jgi:hypothetical protein
MAASLRTAVICDTFCVPSLHVSGAETPYVNCGGTPGCEGTVNSDPMYERLLANKAPVKIGSFVVSRLKTKLADNASWVFCVY